MDWKLIFGDSYVDGMTDEEARAKFNEIYMPRSEHEAEKNKDKQLIDNYSSQIADYKRKQREQMSEAERKEAERQEQWNDLVSNNKKLERDLKIRDLKDQYMSRGFDEELAFSTAEAMFDGDTATVMSNEQIFADKRDAQLRSVWEKEYQINPPAGNGSGKVDYTKQINEAKERGDMVAAASLIRQQNEANNG